MDLMKLFKRTGIKKSKSSATMFDTLESRSLLSASPAIVSGSDANVSAGTFQTFALKSTVTQMKASSKTSALGENVTLTAVVSGKTSTGTPTGTVTFMVGSTVLGTRTLNAQGIAKLPTTDLPVGVNSITAIYNGSGKFSTSTSAAIAHATTAGASTTKLSVTTPTSTLIGNGTGLLARVGSTVNGVMPTGRVLFYDGSTLLGSKVVDSNGHARWLANYLYIGTHDLKAIYQGSTQLLGHRSPVRTVSVTLPSISSFADGVKIGIITPGTGSKATSGQLITADYTLYLASNGKKLESSLDNPGHPFSFILNGGGTIPGFDEGFTNIKAGEKRVIYVPAAQGYGSQGSASGDVPPNNDIVFVVEVHSIS